jgi:dihydroorotase
MKSVVIRGGTVLTEKEDLRVDVRIENDVIQEIGHDLRGDIELDASGCHVLPGLVDLHTHLREPGREEAETIETGSRAGALGGYTALVAMPNTDPAQDSVAVVEFVRAQGRKAGIVEVVPSGCITVERRGQMLAPMAQLAAVGVQVFTDDGNGVQDPALMRRALEYARDLDITLAQHCEVSALTAGAVMHECSCSSTLGLPGWPSVAEELMVHRDIELVRLTGARMHFLHLSTKGSVELVRKAKVDGLPVTAEVTPHHLSLTHELLEGFNPLFKVNPPLRTMDDVDALREGVLDGTIDAIATDHAPHASRDKELPLDQAPPGMLGLETAFGVVGSVLSLSARQMAQVMSVAPARIARLDDRHGLWPAVGRTAHLCVVNLEERWTAEPGSRASKSANNPYVGRALRGRVRHTIYAGEPTVVNGVAVK